MLPRAKIALLPFFHENANSVAMIKHAMTVTKKAIAYLNPNQTPVITMDQPLYSLAKHIQWFKGGKLCCDIRWFAYRNGHTQYVEAGITTSGRAASSSHVKCSC